MFRINVFIVHLLFREIDFPYHNLTINCILFISIIIRTFLLFNFTRFHNGHFRGENNKFVLIFGPQVVGKMTVGKK